MKEPKLVALILAAVALASVSHAAAPKPNVLVIVSDDAGYADFSMQGSKSFRTPRIDSIAANGIRFTSGYVTAPVCSPSRAGLITGRYQQRFGHEENILDKGKSGLGLPTQERTVADAMRAAGYRTIAVGKWHLGAAPQFHPLARGFDDYYGFLSGSRTYFPHGGGGPNRMLRNRTPVKESFQYTTDAFAKEAAAYIRANKNRPFFMYLAFNAVHGPFEAMGKDLKQVRGVGKERAVRCAMTLALDRGVGVVLDELTRQKLFDNTLVFFINDNGGPYYDKNCANNAPLHGFKQSVWEGGLRVPFAVQWPAKLPKGKTVASPVISVDIMPTALAAAGVTTISGKPLDGVNLLPYLSGAKSGPPHAALFWRYGPRRAVRMGDWKLTNDSGKTMLFDLAADIGEKRDLSKQQPAKLKELEAAYAKWNAGNVPPKWVDHKADKKKRH